MAGRRSGSRRQSDKELLGETTRSLFSGEAYHGFGFGFGLAITSAVAKTADPRRTGEQGATHACGFVSAPFELSTFCLISGSIRPAHAPAWSQGINGPRNARFRMKATRTDLAE